MAKFDEWDDPPQELVKREQALWKKHAKAWKAGLPKLLLAAPFRRGFPAPRRRAVSGNEFLRLTTADLAAAPLWTSASVTPIGRSPASSPTRR